MKKNYSTQLLTCLLCFVFTLSGIAQDTNSIISTYISAHKKDLKLSGAITFHTNSIGNLSNKNYNVAYLQQTFNGIKVSNANATVVLKDNKVISFKHTFINNLETKLTGAATAPSLTPNQAGTAALSALGLTDLNHVQLLDFATKEDINALQLSQETLTAPLFYEKAANGNYVLTYEIIVKEPTPHWWLSKINVTTGELVSKYDLNISCNFNAPVVTDANPALNTHTTHKHVLNTNAPSVLSKKSTTHSNSYTNIQSDGAIYNAFPLRVETPIHGDRELLINPSLIATQPVDRPIPSPSGWHDLDGVLQTNTNGNNVAAYEDSDNSNSASSAGSLVDGGATLLFDFPLDLTQEPDVYQDATIVNLFVWNNYVHDVFYAYGFDEDNGNFQEEDYDRFTGFDIPLVTAHNGDGVAAEAQDGSGLNNANFATPADGGNPRMQMFLWGASPFGEFLNVYFSGDFDGLYASTRFPFVDIPRAEDPEVSGSLVVIEDDGAAYTGANGGTAGASPDTDDGCTSIVNAAALNGNIAVIRRGVCTFTTKIYNAEDAGAIGVIIVNNVEGEGPANGGGEATEPITIPTISISFEDGDPMINALNNGESITGRIIDNGPLADLVMKDGDLDQGIIAHEYGHGISTRLVGGRNNSNCLLSLAFEEQMGEGWSDFFALVMTQKLTDTAEQPRGIGTYVLGQDVLGSGIRPARYSTDFSVNDYTYEDLGNAEITVPHGIGFIWSTIIWDMYWAFIDEYGFDADMYYGTGGNNMALQLVMDGLKLQTCGNVGFVDGRDAILMADEALYDGANECLIRSVFARRGVGALAFQGTAISRMDQVPDFTISDPLGTDCEAVLASQDLNKTLFTVYPNPASHQIHINSNKNSGLANVEVYDVNGRKVISKNIDLVNTATLNTAKLETGIYVLQINTDNATYTQKVIIQ
ncbi:T9SS-dependent M36 family metallopeptidase [Croceibacter atlanticus]|jgi:extracellular elastinolytic metalloproteinase|uniref:Metalloprotease, putative n=1 Tax=Croceibacter atlanticus (strain ATCC BAA-628 / JCM 21780 / CIP 108009 / IAM 15332 / KCTC 12090 / HTCC2559) TaxID=216432 RepID=A3U5L8_CROAH|nr:T9SS-dependent M36 family metallopeptidase [Croceibacter atlanticus]EAP87535.1 metalloprotease, putative [Croceibacter atlanticus HTCC2559]